MLNNSKHIVDKIDRFEKRISVNLEVFEKYERQITRLKQKVLNGEIVDENEVDKKIIEISDSIYRNNIDL